MNVHDSTEVNHNNEEMKNTTEEVENYGINYLSSFHEDRAIVSYIDNQTGEEKGAVIDKKGDIIFDLPNFYRAKNYANGYLKCENQIYDLQGSVIYDLNDNFDQSWDMGNGFILVEVLPKGYKTASVQYGVIDGYGNEILPVNDEITEICAGTSYDQNKRFGYSSSNHDREGAIALSNAIIDANSKSIVYLEGYRESSNRNPFIMEKIIR